MGQTTPFTLVQREKAHGPLAKQGLGLLLYKGGTVCDDDFSDVAADAICKEMNFERSIEWKNGPWSTRNDRSHYEISLDNVKCDIPHWKSCSFSEHHNCQHKEDVFLSCLPKGQ